MDGTDPFASQFLIGLICVGVLFFFICAVIFTIVCLGRYICNK